MSNKLTIGRTEVVDLPELGLFNINSKIDTGAATSVLHCEDFFIFEKNEKRYIQCSFNSDSESSENSSLVFPIYSERVVKSSFGQSETRFIFITKIKMFEQLYDIKLSLRDRSDMVYPMLLGRNFINGKFLVDVSKKNLSINSNKI